MPASAGECAVTGLTGGTAVSASNALTCALLTSGTVQCWGYNYSGQLGNGSFSASGGVPTPVAVVGLTGATALSTGGHTCALTGGTVQCWGENPVMATPGPGSMPVAVAGLTGAMAVAVGALHTCALLTGGTVQCWGDNTYSQLGNSSGTPAATPVAVAGLTGATAIAAGSFHTCALLAGGTVQCWGDNNRGSSGTVPHLRLAFRRRSRSPGLRAPLRSPRATATRVRF